MNTKQTIYFNPDTQIGEAHIKIRLEQEIDTLEFMTMSINTEDVYQDFNADYGVLVGRVIANGGIGVPNAKISIFIPLTDEDAQDKDIVSVYPYKTPRDKNNEGKRYNLLPRVSKIDPITNQKHPKQAFGSFPIKEEIVSNLTFLDVYKKYYKYTATTNDAGDYMIFGVPIGTQTVHMSVDITDIGEYSMTPAAMVTNLGYSQNLFTKGNSQIKSSNDLNDLPNIETQDISVNIIPFWGDVVNYEIGITRQDFRIRAALKSTFIVFGSIFTDGDNSMWGQDYDNIPIIGQRSIRELYRMRDDGHNNVSILSKRIGKVTEKIYYYPADITDAEIDDLEDDPNCEKMQLLDPSEYSVYKRDGDFVFIINCNRDKIITVNGNKSTIPYDSPNGVFTKFRGFITLEITDQELPMLFSADIGNKTNIVPFRYRLKFPQHAPKGKSFWHTDFNSGEYTNNWSGNTKTWRKQHKLFESGKFYSFSKFNAIVSNKEPNDPSQCDSNHIPFGYDGFLKHDKINEPYNDDYLWNVGIIVSGDVLDNNSKIEYNNKIYELPTNIKTEGNVEAFGANWLNLSIYLPQLGYAKNGYVYIKYIRSSLHFTQQVFTDTKLYTGFPNEYYFEDNTQEIAASEYNTKWFARSDINWTDIIEIPINDLKILSQTNKKGFTSDEIEGLTLANYRNGVNKPIGWEGACPVNGGKDYINGTNNVDQKFYFYKGFGSSNCIEYLSVLGLIN